MTAPIVGFRLSPQQRRLWAEGGPSGPGGFRAAGLLEIEERGGQLDRALLDRALSAVAADWEILRTVYRTMPGMAEPLQVIEEGAKVSVETVDLSSLPPASRREALLELALESRREGLSVFLADGEEGVRLLGLGLSALAADAAGMRRLAREIAASYRAAAEGRRPAVEPLQYADVAEVLNRLLESDETREGRKRWRSPSPEELSALPATGSPQPGAEARLARHPLAEAAGRSARELARRTGKEISEVCLAAWFALAARHGCEGESVIGVELDGRTFEGLDSALGLFARAVPVRETLSSSQPFADLLADVGRALAAAREHQDFFAWEEGAAGSPGAFPWLFEHRVEGGEEIAAGGVLFRPGAARAWTGSFDLRFSAVERGESLDLALEVDAARVDPSTARRFAERLETLLEAAAKDPNALLGDLPAVGPAEQSALAEALSGCSAPRPESTLHGLFAAQAALAPDRIAVEEEGRALSYAALDRMSDRLAAGLIAAGVPPDGVVAVCLDRSVGLVVSLLAVQKAGAAYLPLDPTAPAERSRGMLADAAACLLLGEAANLAAWEGTGIAAIDWAAALTTSEPARERPRVDPWGLAYVIYTSGSTGRPKGVMISHGAIANRLLWMQENLPLGEQDRVLQKTPFGFDASVWEIFAPLIAGATVVLARPGGHRDPAYLAAAVAERGATLLQLVPSMVQPFLDQPGVEGCLSLRRLFCGGEALPGALVERSRALLSAEVHNLYGPTETSIDATWHPCGAERPEGTTPIGRPLDNVAVRLLDARLLPVPSGVAGELFVAGAGLARGYRERPDLTAERFVPDAWSDHPGERLYRTGDRARLSESGALEFLGRVDRQVKIRGVRVEPEEVEAALAGHPGVATAAVVGRRGEDGRDRLVAYFVGAAAAAPSPEELRRYLAERLPEAMVPSYFVPLPELPVGPTGKLDRLSLPEPERLRPAGERPFAAPRTEEEMKLASIWAELLRRERVGVDENFFELGGDSILAIQLVARAARAGLRFEARQIFQFQTVAELAAVSAPAEAARPREGSAPSGRIPLTPIQRSFFAQDLADPHHYNQAVFVEMLEPPAPGALGTAVAALVAAHPALRFRFERSDDGWRQSDPGPAERGSYARVDLSGLSPARHVEALESAAARVQAGFDLGRPPLFRAVLFELSGGAARLLLIAHHLVVDGVSWRILLEDLEEAYRLAKSGQAPALPPEGTTFAAWVEHLAERARSLDFARAADLWGAPERRLARPLPAGRPEGRNLHGLARTVATSLGAEETKALVEIAPANLKVQINDLLLTALARAFSRWTGEDDLLVEVESHGREGEESGLDLSRTVGWFTALHPVLLSAGGDALADLRTTKAHLREIAPRRLEHGLLAEMATAEGGDASSAVAPAAASAAFAAIAAIAGVPRPEVAFNYLGQTDRGLPSEAALRFARESLGSARSPRQRRRYLFEIDGALRDGRLHWTWTYPAEIYPSAVAERLAESFREELSALAALCREAVPLFVSADFPLAGLSEAALARTIAGASGVVDLYPLSPLQEGLLFHALEAPEAGFYVVQWSCVLEGHVDGAALRAAWQHLVDRHAALRTAFRWGEEKPLQIVFAGADLEWGDLDWRGLGEEEQRLGLERHLAKDRRKAFDLSRAPLLRAARILLADDRCFFLWSHHHLVLDGWCSPILLGEAFASYRALAAGEPPRLAPPRPYRDYIAWLAESDLAGAEAFWRETLRGYAQPTLLPGDGGEMGGEDFGDLATALSEAASSALGELARAHGVTLNTLVQAAWGLLLARECGRGDVVFGATVSGRPPEIAGVERMVGLFINTLPVRVRLASETGLADWLRDLQRQQAEARRYEFTPLSRIRDWSEVPAGQPLSEAIMTFENFPVDERVKEALADLGPIRVRGVRQEGRNSNPLTLLASPGARVALRLLFNRRRFREATIRRYLDDLGAILAAFVAESGGTLKAVEERLAERETGRREAEGEGLDRRLESSLQSRLKARRSR